MLTKITLVLAFAMAVAAVVPAFTNVAHACTWAQCY
jgi:hypothetical protein